MRALRIARVAGIDIAIHPSWLVIFLLVTWSLASAYFPETVRGEGSTTYWVLGLVASLLLFGSVLLHELAHSLVALRMGLPVTSITLFLFGGVSNLAAESPRPGVEFLIAVVGPLSSLAIGGVSAAIAVASSSSGPFSAVFGYLAVVNVLLGLFNLIPGYPLDGGRVFRAIAWQVTGSLRRATDLAGGAGQLVAYAFFIWGFFRVLNGDLFGGLWIAAIGWFLQTAASASVHQVRLEQSLRGLPVTRILRPDDRAVGPDLPVSRLISEYFLPLNRRAMPVVDVADRLIGIITLGDVRTVPEEARPTVPVRAVMGGADGLAVVRPSDSLATALEALGRGDYEQVPVVDGDGRLIGMLTRADVLRQFQLRSELGVEGAAGSGGRPATQAAGSDGAGGSEATGGSEVAGGTGSSRPGGSMPGKPPA